MRKLLPTLTAFSLLMAVPLAVGADNTDTASEKSENSNQPKTDAELRKKYRQTRGTPPCLTWVVPDGAPRAVLLCVHGCGLHAGSYKDLGEQLAKRGIVTYAVDVRGFGSFQQAQGRDVIDLKGCMWDVEETLKVLRKAHPGLPVYLLGESMGGAITLHVTSEHPELVDGLISSVPAGTRFKSTGTDLRVAWHALKGGLHKNFNIGQSIINQATEKPELRKEWAEDPMARMNLSPMELLEFKRFCDGNVACARKVHKTPVLFVQGCGDKLIKPESTYKIFTQLPVEDKWLLQVGNAEHLIFEEHQFNDAIIDMLVKWIEQPNPKRTALDPNSSSCKLSSSQVSYPDGSTSVVTEIADSKQARKGKSTPGETRSITVNTDKEASAKSTAQDK